MLGRLLEGRERSAIFIAAGLGLIFPVCDSAIAPLVKRLLSKGVPLSVAIAFLLAGPIVNPIVAASTWLAYQGDWSFLVTRMVLGYAVAIVVAFLMDFLFRDKKALLIETPSEFEHTCDCCGHDHAPEKSDNKEKRLFFALQHACDDFFNIGKFLVIGAFIAALARNHHWSQRAARSFVGAWNSYHLNDALGDGFKPVQSNRRFHSRWFSGNIA